MTDSLLTSNQMTPEDRAMKGTIYSFIVAALADHEMMASAPFKEQLRDAIYNFVRSKYGGLPIETTERPVSAMQSLTAALQADSEYAWSWHCNLAMPIMDSLKCSHTQANQAAATLMQHLFHIDIRRNRNWSNTVAEVALIQSPAETSDHLGPVGHLRKLGWEYLTESDSLVRIPESEKTNGY